MTQEDTLTDDDTNSTGDVHHHNNCNQTKAALGIIIQERSVEQKASEITNLGLGLSLFTRTNIEHDDHGATARRL